MKVNLTRVSANQFGGQETDIGAESAASYFAFDQPIGDLDEKGIRNPNQLGTPTREDSEINLDRQRTFETAPGDKYFAELMAAAEECEDPEMSAKKGHRKPHKETPEEKEAVHDRDERLERDGRPHRKFGKSRKDDKDEEELAEDELDDREEAKEALLDKLDMVDAARMAIAREGFDVSVMTALEDAGIFEGEETASTEGLFVQMLGDDSEASAEVALRKLDRVKLVTESKLRRLSFGR